MQTREWMSPLELAVFFVQGICRRCRLQPCAISNIAASGRGEILNFYLKAGGGGQCRIKFLQSKQLSGLGAYGKNAKLCTHP